MPFSRPALRITTVLVAAFATAALLAGCTHASSTAKDTPKAHDTSNSAPSDGASAPAAEPSSTPTPTPTPVTMQQGEVWTAQQVYDFNPNFSPDPNYQPSDAAAKLVALKGVSFGWVNQTSSDTIEIAVAHPSAQNFDQFSGAVASGGAQQVPIDGAPADTVSYFNVDGGVGRLDIFTANGYWVVIDSKIFLEPGDSYQIASAVMGNLK